MILSFKNKKLIFSSSRKLIQNLYSIINKDVNYKFERYMGQYPFLEDQSKSTKFLKTPNLNQQESQDSKENEIKTDNISDKVEMAKSVTNSFMFPWERRQMEDNKAPLKTWEKVYWWFFIGGIAFLLFSWNKRNTQKEKEKEVDEELENKKKEVARAILAGKSLADFETDPFNGLSPAQIEEYVQSVTGASHSDPFEGLSPDEINEYVKKHGVPSE